MSSNVQEIRQYPQAYGTEAWRRCTTLSRNNKPTSTSDVIEFTHTHRANSPISEIERLPTLSGKIRHIDKKAVTDTSMEGTIITGKVIASGQWPGIRHLYQNTHLHLEKFTQVK